jgi:hypothetical protein
MTDDDTPSDILNITTTEYNAARIESELIKGVIYGSDDDKHEFGIQVHQDGRDIAMSAGTTYPDEPALHTYHGLSIEEAREIAASLNEAADRAEDVKAQNEQSEGKSLLERLIP